MLYKKDLKKPYDCVKGRLRKECLGNKVLYFFVNFPE